jgi:hypothetical protein
MVYLVLFDARMANRVFKRPQHRIRLWKTLSLGLLILFFVLSLVWLINKPERVAQDWMWPVLFIPPLFYLFGINLEDLPARYYTLGALEPFPIPFSMMFDRAVIAIIILFSGLILNAVFLIASLAIEPLTLQNLLFGLYMGIMLLELPNSIRIFRFLQHVHILHVAKDEEGAVRAALAAFTPDARVPTTELLDDPAFTRRIYEGLENEARELVREHSPLGKEQQFNLNLAIRGGEAVYQAESAVEHNNRFELATALGIIQSLCRHGPIQPPENIAELRRALARLEEADTSAFLASSPVSPSHGTA